MLEKPTSLPSVPHYTLPLAPTSQVRVAGYIDSCDQILKFGHLEDKEFLWVYVKKNQIVGFINKGFLRESGLLYFGMLWGGLGGYQWLRRGNVSFGGIEGWLRGRMGHVREDLDGRVFNAPGVGVR